LRRPKSQLLKIVAFIVLLPYALAIPYLLIPPPSTLMITDLLSLRMPHRDWVSIEKISPHLIKAVVASEDGAFCDHWGFDFTQIEKTIDKAIDGKRHGGASTITMQTAKNLFLWTDRSWLRKALEAPLTLWLELIWSKRRILEVYLNVAEWGPGIYGAESAARHHFGVSARHLSLWQSALLAASLPDPLDRRAGHPGPGQIAGAATIARRALHNGPDLYCIK
jgi:monofunctional glycosyltransferase